MSLYPTYVSIIRASLINDKVQYTLSVLEQRQNVLNPSKNTASEAMPFKVVSAVPGELTDLSPDDKKSDTRSKLARDVSRNRGVGIKGNSTQRPTNKNGVAQFKASGSPKSLPKWRQVLLRASTPKEIPEDEMEKASEVDSAIIPEPEQFEYRIGAFALLVVTAFTSRRRWVSAGAVIVALLIIALEVLCIFSIMYSKAFNRCIFVEDCDFGHVCEYVVDANKATCEVSTFSSVGILSEIFSNKELLDAIAPPHLGLWNTQRRCTQLRVEPTHIYRATRRHLHGHSG